MFVCCKFQYGFYSLFYSIVIHSHSMNTWQFGILQIPPRQEFLSQGSPDSKPLAPQSPTNPQSLQRPIRLGKTSPKVVQIRMEATGNSDGI